jgi:hypothetical protein
MELRRFFLAFLLVGVIGISSCGGDDESKPIEQKVCERLDECNVSFLLMSIQDCTEVIQSCSDDLLSSEYKDWENAVNDCLGFTNCANFAACYDEIDVCYLVDLSGDGGGGGSSGGSSDGAAGGSSDGTAGEAGSSSGGDGSAGTSGSSSGGDGSSDVCTDGDTSCVDDYTLNYCDVDVWVALDCDSFCVDVFGAGAYSAGCMYIAEEGMDDCLCVY